MPRINRQPLQFYRRRVQGTIHRRRRPFRLAHIDRRRRPDHGDALDRDTDQTRSGGPKMILP